MLSDDGKVMAELSSGVQRQIKAQGSDGEAWLREATAKLRLAVTRCGKAWLGNVRAKVGNVL